MASTNVHNYGRRNSSVYHYLIPQKSAAKFPHQHHHHHHHHQLQHQHQHHLPHQPSKLSSSVPTFSRGFVSRRTSEGETGRLKELLNCEACGKGYKHISSLAKHLWEHTPEWNMTKKLLLSKHQQVQLLEAASILVGMNDPEETDHFTSSPTPESLQFSTSYDANRSYIDTHETSPYHRSHLISEYPPSLIPSTYSPMPGYVGGYLDVPKRRIFREEDESVLEESPEPDGNEEEDDDEILGKME